MTRVDLITGFLGSGKTTFIHRYLHHLHEKDQKIRIIENEFGCANIDTKLLAEEDVYIDDLAGVCMCCTGKDKFVQMLVNAADAGCDRVLVEPSGIYDVDEFFSVMSERRVKECCEVGSVLTIVDARFADDLSGEARYLMFAQLLAAGKVILSKSQFCPEEEIRGTIGKLNELIESFKGDRVLGEDVCTKSWDDLTEEDYTEFRNCGHSYYAHTRQFMDHGEVFSTFMTAEYCEDEEDVNRRIRGLLENESYGQVIRVKGYIRDLMKNWYEINCTRQDISIRPVTNIKRGVLVVIGQDLNDPELKKAFLPGPDKKSLPDGQ